MDLIDRFRYIIKINNMSPSTFADEIGVQRSSVSHVLSGRNKPGMDFIQKVLDRFPKVDAAWLISGAKDGQFPLDIHDDPDAPTVNPPVDDEKIMRDPSLSPGNSSKKIVKVLIFYSDNTFEEFRHS